MELRTSPDPGEAALTMGPLVLYDGVCNLCAWSVQFLAPRDRSASVLFAAIQSPAGEAVLRRHGLPLSDYGSFVFLDGGRIYLKSAAFFRVVRYMRFPWPLLRLGLVFPAVVADWLYDRVAKNRYAVFGKKQLCVIPEAALRDRFID